MSNVSTFGTFTMARLGIYASHKALDITGNNISNINTEGYTRQSIDQVSLNMGAADRNQSMMDTRVGSGVFVLGVTQMRDQFLDIRYRTELTNVGAMESKDSGLTEIKRVIDEVGKGEDGEGVLEARFNDMIQMMENLVTKGAGKDEFDTLFRSACSATVDTIHAYANALSVAESNLRDRFEQQVNAVNTSLQRIQELNVGIRKAQVYGGNALILQDERNLLIDEISKFFNIDVSIEKEELGEKVQVDKLVIKTSDMPTRTLVDGIFVGQLAIRQEENENGELVDSPTLQLDFTALKDPTGRAITETTDLDNELQDSGKAAEGTAKYTTRADAKKVADTMNEDNPAEDGGEYRVVAVTNKDIGTTYEVHLFSRERTMASKNGESVDEEFYEITSDEAAAKKAAEDAMAAYKEAHPAEEGTEYRVVRTSKEVDVTDTDGNPVTDTDGNPEKKTVYGYEVRLFEPATYKTEEEAKTALEALQKSIQDGDTNYTTAETLDDGSKVHYEYRIAKGLEDPPNFEIHKFQIFSGEVEFGDQELRGSFQEQREILTKEGIFSTKEQLEDDPAASSKRGIPYYRKSLDVLANSLATLMNKLNLDAFKAANPNWEADKLTLPVLFSNDGTTDATDEPLINALNISISKSWANGSFKVQTTTGTSELTQSTATDNVARMLSMLQNDVRFTPQGAVVRTTGNDGSEKWVLSTALGETDKTDYKGINADAASTDVFFTGTFQELFTNHMNGNLGRDMNMTKTMLKSYETVAEDLYVSRDGVMGVDLNDEAMNMMMYEKSYSAACRLMTVYDGMLDKLINGTAV